MHTKYLPESSLNISKLILEKLSKFSELSFCKRTFFFAPNTFMHIRLNISTLCMTVEYWINSLKAVVGV